MKRSWTASWALIAFAVLSLLPLAAGLVYAAAYSIGWAGLLSEGFTLSHWMAVLRDPETWRSVVLSLWVATLSVALSLALGLIVALGLAERWGSPLWSYALHLPLVLPPTAAALVFFQVWTGGGWMARLLHHMGIEGALDGRFALVPHPWALAIVLTETFLLTPFLALSFRGIYLGENLRGLEDAAASLGATRFQTMVRVVLPVLLKRSAPTVILLFVVVVGAYEIPLLLGRPSPEMLSVLILRKFNRFDLGEKPEALAVTVIYAVFVAISVFLLLGPLVRGGRTRS